MNEPLVTIVGGTVKDFELRYTPAGKAVASGTVVVNSRKKDENGKWIDGDASFYRVNCWDSLAENVSESIPKGTRVVVVGTMKIREYEDKDENKRTSVEITAQEIAPSLKWSTAQIVKTERQSPGDSGYDSNEETY